MGTQLLLFIAVALALAGQLSDIITTDVALAHGWAETISAPAKLIKWLGVTALTGIKVVGFGIVAPLLTTIIELHFNAPGYAAGTCVALAASAAGFFAGVTNYLRLKAAKISVF